MAAGIWNPTIEQGETWVRTLTFTDADGEPLPMTGWTGRMHVRHVNNPASAIATLTTSNGGITITGSTGTVKLELNEAATRAMPAMAGHPYDLELVDALGQVHKYLRGVVTVRAEYSR